MKQSSDMALFQFETSPGPPYAAHALVHEAPASARTNVAVPMVAPRPQEPVESITGGEADGGRGGKY